MSKYSTDPTFLEFERLFGTTAVENLLQSIIETQHNEGDRGGDGISLSVDEYSIGRYAVSGYMDYAGQEITFELDWGHGHGTEVTAFCFDKAEVLRNRKQVLDDLTRDSVLGDFLDAVLLHAEPALAVCQLTMTPHRAPARLDIQFDVRRFAVGRPCIIGDSGLGISYPGVAQCALEFRGEDCHLTVGLAALHPDDDIDFVELTHWESAFSTVNFFSDENKLDAATGLLDVEKAVVRLKNRWVHLGTVRPEEAWPQLETLEHQFAQSLIDATVP